MNNKFYINIYLICSFLSLYYVIIFKLFFKENVCFRSCKLTRMCRSRYIRNVHKPSVNEEDIEMVWFSWNTLYISQIKTSENIYKHYFGITTTFGINTTFGITLTQLFNIASSECLFWILWVFFCVNILLLFICLNIVNYFLLTYISQIMNEIVII